MGSVSEKLQGKNAATGSVNTCASTYEYQPVQMAGYLERLRSYRLGRDLKPQRNACVSRRNIAVCHWTLMEYFCTSLPCGICWLQFVSGDAMSILFHKKIAVFSHSARVREYGCLKRSSGEPVLRRRSRCGSDEERMTGTRWIRAWKYRRENP